MATRPALESTEKVRESEPSCSAAEDDAPCALLQELGGAFDGADAAPHLAWKLLDDLRDQRRVGSTIHCRVEIDELHEGEAAEALDPFGEVRELHVLAFALHELNDLSAHQVDRRNQHGHLMGIPAA